MMANCQGCKEELGYIFELSAEGLHFAGVGFYEKGHLFIRMVNDKGEIIVE